MSKTRNNTDLDQDSKQKSSKQYDNKLSNAMEKMTDRGTIKLTRDLYYDIGKAYYNKKMLEIGDDPIVQINSHIKNDELAMHKNKAYIYFNYNEYDSALSCFNNIIRNRYQVKIDKFRADIRKDFFYRLGKSYYSCAVKQSQYQNTDDSVKITNTGDEDQFFDVQSVEIVNCEAKETVMQAIVFDTDSTGETKEIVMQAIVLDTDSTNETKNITTIREDDDLRLIKELYEKGNYDVVINILEDTASTPSLLDKAKFYLVMSKALKIKASMNDEQCFEIINDEEEKTPEVDDEQEQTPGIDEDIQENNQQTHFATPDVIINVIPLTNEFCKEAFYNKKLKRGLLFAPQPSVTSSGSDLENSELSLDSSSSNSSSGNVSPIRINFGNATINKLNISLNKKNTVKRKKHSSDDDDPDYVPPTKSRKHHH